MLTIDTATTNAATLQDYLHDAIAPRPIGLVSTVDNAGNVNLSPFSYFNLFSINPPICIFSPTRRIPENTTKHTLENIKEVAECVINVVTFNMVEQISKASNNYPKNVNEFVEAGLTPIASELVRPPRVLESPIQLECTVEQIIELGTEAGAGNLVIAHIRKIHINESVLDSTGKIDPTQLDLIARLGGDWYTRVTQQSLFSLKRG
jgi:flavin reductase (DIM6/NTAB) family NADH-FMN oxidoreductase RutF